ncbi:MAG: SH3 domain-containing protein [Goleter apudmare HA4340-LM2]|jgi:uncharacterized protein YgiM (DUF1202 family)|nr:SH3 domain-containing protein [Goleter apudmare HA4340-LM2]
MSKIFKAFMTSAVILASALPATATPASFSSPQVGKSMLVSQNSTIRVCTRDRNGLLNMRSGPGTGYRVVYRVPNRTIVSVLNSTDRSYGGYYWYEVAFRNQVGWVRGDFVC